MNPLRSILLLPFATTLTLAQLNPSSNPASQPRALVRSFYTEVLARHPHDIPNDADMKVFIPYFSKSLLHKIDEGQACSADWDHHNPEPHLKAEMASKFDPFSGKFYSIDPQSFHIEKTQLQKDGSLRVYVNLKKKDSSGYQSTWGVAVVVMQEAGHYVVDDVIYINDSVYEHPADKPPDPRLSEYLSAGCDGPRWGGYSLPREPAALIQSLYRQVAARTPSGIPTGADWKIFAPYMSKTLLHRIDEFDACVADWDRHQDLKNPEKAPFGIFESGMFSGGNERGEPRSFHVERTQSQQDGSTRVYVKLAWWEAPANPPDKYRTTIDKPYIWHVAPIVVRENDRLVVVDVIFLKDPKDDDDVEYRLSQTLSEGCKGSHYVGDRNSERSTAAR
jgi:hypothetical protein